MSNELKNVEKWLRKHEFKPETITLNYQDGKKMGIKVDTEYEGPYPNGGVFHMHQMIRNHIAKRYKDKLSVESRGYYTAVYVIEK